MPTPQGIKTVTIHGLAVEPDLTGTPILGSVTFTPNVGIVTFTVENALMGGTETAVLDSNGEFYIDLPCTNTPGQNPDGWTYTVTEKFIGVKGRTYQIFLPFTNAVVELADLAPTTSAPVYLPVVGPQGPPGVVTTVNGYSSSDINLTAADVQAVPLVTRGVALGVATLDVNVKVPLAQIPDLGSIYLAAGLVDTNGGVVGRNSSGQAALPTIRLTSTTDQSLTSTGHAFQIGPDNGSNLRMDDNEISSYNNGSVATLHVQSDGGSLTLFNNMANGATADTLSAKGNLTIHGVSTFGYNDVYVMGNARLGVGVSSSPASRALIQTALDEVALEIKQTLAGATKPVLALTPAAAANMALGAKLAGDAQYRVVLRASGNLEMGPGSGAADVTLYRSAAGTLSSTGQFTSDVAAPTAVGHLTRKDYVDGQVTTLNTAINARVTLTTAQSITGPKSFENASSALPAFLVKATGDSQPRLSMRADARMGFGSGGAAADVTLYRSGVGLLYVDQSFNVGASLQVNGRDQGRGLMASATIPQVVLTNTTETVFGAVPVMTWVNGRAYRVEIWGYASATSSTFLYLRIRKNSGIAGTTLVDQMRIQTLAGATSNTPVSLSVIITNTSGADISANICLTGQANSGVTSTQWSSNGASVNSYMTVEDIGLAADWPGNSIT